MANLFEHKDRRVVPNWRSFGTTTILGELNSFHIDSGLPDQETIIDSYIVDWKLNKTVIHASDLLSAALVNNKKDNKTVLDAANFILQNSKNATISQISLASGILDKTIKHDLSERFKGVTLERLSELINPEPIRIKIRVTKKTLQIYPSNAILYVELSRYYSILGQEFNSIPIGKWFATIL